MGLERNFGRIDGGPFAAVSLPEIRSLKGEQLSLVNKWQMEDGYPDDADGQALRHVAYDGSDMSSPMYVNFQVALPDEEAARGLAARVSKLGYNVRIYNSAECKLPWTCECSTRMLATYESVIAIQEELAKISVPIAGFPDGWGTFGNGPNGQPDVT